MNYAISILLIVVVLFFYYSTWVDGVRGLVQLMRRLIGNPDLARKKRDANFVWTDEKTNKLD